MLQQSVHRMKVHDSESSLTVLSPSSSTLRRTLSKVLKPKRWGRSTRSTADLEPDIESDAVEEPEPQDTFKDPVSQVLPPFFPPQAGLGVPNRESSLNRILSSAK